MRVSFAAMQNRIDASQTIAGRLGLTLHWSGAVALACASAFALYVGFGTGEGGWTLALFSFLAGAVLFGLGRLSLFILGGR